jgi:hypothetical protein
MKKVMAARAAAIVALAWPGALAAHHSLERFDTTTPVWLKGTVIRFDRVAPHARINIEQKTGGKTQRWSIDGPAPNALDRVGIGKDFMKEGDEVEVCGFPLKGEFEEQSAAALIANPGLSLGRAFSGHLLVMPSAKARHRCRRPAGRRCQPAGHRPGLRLAPALHLAVAGCSGTRLTPLRWAAGGWGA